MSDREDAQNRIRAVIAQWLELVASKDAQSIAGLYAEDGRFMVPNASAAEGRPAIAAMWAHLLSLPGVSLDFGPTLIETAASGDLAYEVGTYRLAYDTEAGRKQDSGKYVVVWKNEGGSWKAAADILNSDLPAS